MFILFREIKETNRKFLYTIQKEFLKFVAPENPLGVGLEIEDDEVLGDEGIDLKTLKKNSRIFKEMFFII